MSLSDNDIQVEIDPGAGFCFGVEKAIALAEGYLRRGEKVYGLGQMVHNENETGRLEKMGLHTIGIGDFGHIGASKVILRAHGEPPSTYTEAEKYGVELIDATCPIVKNLQKKVRTLYSEMDPSKTQIVIFGKEGHPETIGLIGQTNGAACLVTDPDDFGHLDQAKAVYLFSQTTMDPEEFYKLEANLREHFEVAGIAPVVAECSICNQMKKRKPELAKFAISKDLVLFISGKNSSNGKMLYEFCRGVNRNTRWISSPDEIRKEWFRGIRKIGISGATSTSVAQLEGLKETIIDLLED